jgi:cold shock protein
MTDTNTNTNTDTTNTTTTMGEYGSDSGANSGETTTLGLVKWFQGGFGFITNFETKDDVFVHHSGVSTTIDCWKLLYPGEYVYYTVSLMDDGKSQAVNVTGVRGGPLRCETLSILRTEREDHNEKTGNTRSSNNRGPRRNTRQHTTNTSSAN